MNKVTAAEAFATYRAAVELCRSTFARNESIVGEYGEHLAAQALGGTLAPVSNIDDAMWTKFLGKRRLKLQNPFKQNVGHIDGIRKAVGDNDLPCINVVLINGKCRFSGTQPEWLCMGSDELIAKLKSRANSMAFSASQLERYHSQLLTVRKKPGLITDLEHIAHLNRRHKVMMKPTYFVTYYCINMFRFFYRWF
ncbi:hypothetical protein [Leclercia adecarboxylata]|uniref:hypothetical protein n=1 Tax=Leclercia adecarboxylata TaxID=83655 RepID=UPI00370A265D